MLAPVWITNTQGQPNINLGLKIQVQAQAQDHKYPIQISSIAAQLFLLHHKKMLGGVSILAQKKKENLTSPAESEASHVESEREKGGERERREIERHT